MSDVFINELKIKQPDYNLGVEENTQCRQVGKMMLKLEEVLLKERSDIVLVYGDTNSTLAGALSAKKLNFKLAHVEVGLRSFNRDMQEEVNRIVTDKISDILFCPTKNAYENLKDEGFLLERNKYRVYLVGNVMYDCFLFFKNIALLKSKVLNRIFSREKKNYILVTIHRAENTDNINRLNKILKLLNDIIGFNGKIVWDTSKPDGQPKRCLDVTKAEKEFEFVAKIKFDKGLKKTIEWYKDNF